jgi:hypothetical protein
MNKAPNYLFFVPKAVMEVVVWLWRGWKKGWRREKVLSEGWR